MMTKPAIMFQGEGVTVFEAFRRTTKGMPRNSYKYISRGEDSEERNR